MLFSCHKGPEGKRGSGEVLPQTSPAAPPPTLSPTSGILVPSGVGPSPSHASDGPFPGCRTCSKLGPDRPAWDLAPFRRPHPCLLLKEMDVEASVPTAEGGLSRKGTPSGSGESHSLGAGPGLGLGWVWAPGSTSIPCVGGTHQGQALSQDPALGDAAVAADLVQLDAAPALAFLVAGAVAPVALGTQGLSLAPAPHPTPTARLPAHLAPRLTLQEDGPGSAGHLRNGAVDVGNTAAALAIRVLGAGVVVRLPEGDLVLSTAHLLPRAQKRPRSLLRPPVPHTHTHGKGNPASPPAPGPSAGSSGQWCLPPAPATPRDTLCRPGIAGRAGCAELLQPQAAGVRQWPWHPK